MNATGNQPYYRSDAPLIRHIAKHIDLPTAKDYARIPLVILDNLMLEDEIINHSLVDGHEQLPEKLDHLLWDDALYEIRHYPFSNPDVDSFRIVSWIRVTRDEHVDPTYRDVPLRPDHTKEDVNIEYWICDPEDSWVRSVPCTVTINLSNITGEWCYSVMNGLDIDDKDLMKEDSVQRMNWVIQWWIKSQHYLLTAGNEYFIEVTPPPNTTMKPGVLREKPWLKPRSHITLINPSEIKKYRTPSPQLEHEPIEQLRHVVRGHWRRLISPCYARNFDGTIRQIWVKPHWRGSLEWEFQGQRYKVIDKNFELGGQLEGRAKGDA